MGEYRLKDKSEVYEVVCVVIADLGRTDTPYSYGVAFDRETETQIIYFDLPRISPLQFNVSTSGITERQELISKIKAAIKQRLAIG